MPRPDKGSPKSKTPPPNSDEVRQSIAQLIGQLVAWDWIQQNSTLKVGKIEKSVLNSATTILENDSCNFKTRDTETVSRMQNTTTNLHAEAAEDADWKMSQSVLADFQRIAEQNQNRGNSSFRVGSIVDDRRFHQLVDENEQWFRDRMAENEVIYYLDWNHYLLLNEYYSLSPAEQRIEAEFSTLCQFHRTLGVSQFNAIKFAPLSDGLNNELLKLRPWAESEWIEQLNDRARLLDTQ